jgi:alkylated DNA nucleotide flippase Atl1
MLIASPLSIQDYVSQIPRGEVRTLSQLRAHLANQHNADYTCPLTTGIFLNVVAKAAEEEQRRDIPWWRVVRDNGRMQDKFPDAPERQARLLADEGVQLTNRRGNMFASFALK